MNRDAFMRRALWATAVFNVGGALLFAFPESLGRVAGLPSPVPGVYAALLASFVLLFAGMYAWLARQPRIDRPMVGLAAIGKTSVFVLVGVFWMTGELPGLTVIAAAGDLGFAGIFVWWLRRARP
jgi:hypothetical protein